MVSQCGNGVVEFRFFRPQAKEVFLVGDFNDWNERSHPMTRQPDGEWYARLRLSDGAHQFHYLADDEWYEDYLAFGLERCPNGYNSVVLVGEAEEPAIYVG